MELREILAIAMFVGFIGLIFTGFPVAWVLGGLAVLFTALGIVFERDLGRSVARVGFGRVDVLEDLALLPAIIGRRYLTSRRQTISFWIRT